MSLDVCNFLHIFNISAVFVSTFHVKINYGHSVPQSMQGLVTIFQLRGGYFFGFSRLNNYNKNRTLRFRINSVERSEITGSCYCQLSTQS